MELPPAADGSPQKQEEHNVKFTLAGDEKHTKFNKEKTDADIEQTLDLYVAIARSLSVCIRNIQILTQRLRMRVMTRE